MQSQRRIMHHATAAACRLNIGLVISKRRCHRTIVTDSICELSSSNLRYGVGSTVEIGQDIAHLLFAPKSASTTTTNKTKKVVIFTDKTIASLPCMEKVCSSLETSGVKYEIYSKVRVEPNDVSFQNAIGFMKQKQFDAVVALGGGSVIDTAKAANLYSSLPNNNCNGEEGEDEDSCFYDYVNTPIGKGLPIPGNANLLPLFAIPTTAGTGSETTGVAIFDDSNSKSKTGIAHRKLRPHLGIIDPDNTLTLPPQVAKYSGLDVLCHAVESYTALPFTDRPQPASPILRPAYQGSNPISDIWSLQALKLTVKYLKRAIDDASDIEARSNMLLASSAAGIGFGNAGVHLCHGMSYAISSQVKDYRPPGYDVDHPLVPHGHSVIVNAPAVFRFTGSACPERHFECANILANGRNKTLKYDASAAGAMLADELSELMLLLNVPFGLKALGYCSLDIPSLVQGTLPQHRVTKLSPKPVNENDLELLFQETMDAS